MSAIRSEGATEGKELGVVKKPGAVRPGFGTTTPSLLGSSAAIEKFAKDVASC